MQKFIFSLIACVFFINLVVTAQCPDQAFLYKRLTDLDESTIPAGPKLEELQGYLSRMTTCPYRNDSTHVLLLNSLAGVYQQQGDYAKAIRYRRLAIDLLSAHAGKPSVKLTSLPIQYYRLSLSYDSLGNFSEKMKALDSCSAIAMRLNYVDRASLTAIFTFILYYFDIGDYKRCIDYALRCQSLAEQYKINNTAEEQLVGDMYVSSGFGWQVIALMKLKNFTEAEKLLINKVDAFKRAGLTNYLGTTYSQLAEVQLNKNNIEKAHSFYKLALKYDQKAGHTFNCKQTLKDIGYTIYYSHFNDNNKAMACYKKALTLTNKEPRLNRFDIFETMDIHAKMANVFVRKKQYDSAFHHFHLAFDQVKPGTNETDLLRYFGDEIISFKKINYLTRLLLDKGNAYLQRYREQAQIEDVRQAILIFKATDQLLDRIRQEQKDPESKLLWRSDSRRLYENAIEACYLAHNPVTAFYFFEKSRAVLLSDQLNEQHWQKQKEIQQQTQLKKNILLLQRKLAAGQSLADSTLQNELFTKKQQLDRLQESIRTSNPLYYQNFLDTGFISLPDVRKNILNDHQALMEIFEGDSAVYTLLIMPTYIQLQKTNKSIFDNLSGLFIKHISNPSFLNKNYSSFLEISRQFYQLLFQQVRLPKGRIIISPDKQYFPFEALVISTQPLSFFIDEHAVSYTYSARYLLNSFSSTTSPTTSSFIGMAPLQYAPSLNLAALPGSDKSLQQAKAWFPQSNNLIAENASRSNFLQQFHRYKIIQLYTHATDSGYNAEPMIYFRDSALLLSDLIYESSPATRLIVLSACETGTGKLYLGEGVFSFSRGFAALGIPSSVTNLWQVDNESTYRLTELFYKWLAKELPVDVALQKAKLEFIKTATREKQLPYYWAAPVLTGRSDAISINKPLAWKWMAGLFCVCAIVFFTWKRRTQKNLLAKTENNVVRNFKHKEI